MPSIVRKVIGWALSVSGVCLILFGLWAVFAYLWGVIGILGEADQSWIFWGLALLFIGICAGLAGSVLFLFGRRLRRMDVSGD